jgi:hypothetical protein
LPRKRFGVTGYDLGITTGDLLSQEQREQFERDGYLILDSTGLAPEVLDAIVDDVEGLYNPSGPERVESGVRAVGARVQEAWRVSENVKALALSSKILGVLEELFGRKPLPAQTLNFRVGSQQLPHSDAFHFNSEPPGYMCGLWVPLEDIDLDNGPLMYFPGSHKLKEATWDDVGFHGRESDFPSDREYMAERRAHYERYVKRVRKENGYEEPEYALIRKGQALIWASNLLHGGARQTDRTRTRHSQVTHYYFEGVRPFNAMREVPGVQRFWSYPEWIKADRPREPTAEFVREAIEGHTDEGSIVLVVSNGNEQLLALEGRNGWHFPQDEDGNPLDYPESSEAAIAQVEDMRKKGARYLAWPKNTTWWLIENFGAFHEHLEGRYPTVLRDGGSAVIFDLSGS